MAVKTTRRGRPTKPEGRVRRYGVSFSENELAECDQLARLLAKDRPGEPSRADVFSWAVEKILSEMSGEKP